MQSDLRNLRSALLIGAAMLTLSSSGLFAQGIRLPGIGVNVGSNIGANIGTVGPNPTNIVSLGNVAGLGNVDVNLGGLGGLPVPGPVPGPGPGPIIPHGGPNGGPGYTSNNGGPGGVPTLGGFFSGGVLFGNTNNQQRADDSARRRRIQLAARKTNTRLARVQTPAQPPSVIAAAPTAVLAPQGTVTPTQIPPQQLASAINLDTLSSSLVNLAPPNGAGAAPVNTAPTVGTMNNQVGLNQLNTLMGAGTTPTVTQRPVANVDVLNATPSNGNALVNIAALNGAAANNSPQTPAGALGVNVLNAAQGPNGTLGTVNIANGAQQQTATPTARFAARSAGPNIPGQIINDPATLPSLLNSANGSPNNNGNGDTAENANALANGSASGSGSAADAGADDVSAFCQRVLDDSSKYKKGVQERCERQAQRGGRRS